jgi:xanthine/CO dehydrogenase XdhC/CoxF family maturation factor
MHLGTTALLDFFHEHREDQSLVLVTIIATEGSTYRKPGAMMLISEDNRYEGMISGGCLEGDLLHHAGEVFASGEPKFLTYDMHADEELVWSLGLGCDGIIHLLLQRLDRDEGFPLFAKLLESRSLRRPVLLALASAPAGPTLPGAMAMLDISGDALGEQSMLALLRGVPRTPWPEWRCVDREGATLINIPPRTRVLICGAGPDAVPVAQAISSLGWECLVVDHRPAFAKSSRFPPSCTVIRTRPAGLAQHVDLNQLDAAVVMSHHLENDSAYLSQLAPHDIPYVGVLGPRARRDRLRAMASCPDRKVFGPVGLDIGAELPESIALSIAAEIHATLNARSGLSLTPEPGIENSDG